MKKLITTVAIIISATTITMSQCTASYSFTASSDTVSFTNLSSVPNAHYFWNFGDGTGSDSVNPIHAFPGTGDYMVTLFAKDTVSNCSTYYEQWVRVIKPFAGLCHPGITDSIYDSAGSDWLNVYDTCMNCGGYTILYEGGPDYWWFPPISLGGKWQTTPFRMVCAGIYFDTTNGLNTAEAFKTAYYHYSSSHNYGDSSANFEFTVVSKDSLYERILYTAMNKTAASYQWFTGDTVTSTSDTVSLLYPLYPSIPAAYFTSVGLVIQTPTGYHDTIYQNILIGVGDTLYGILSINEIKNNVSEVKVYPNPNNGVFVIAMRQAPEKQSNSTIEIYNMLGEKIYQAPLNPPKGGISTTIVKLPPSEGGEAGIYLYRVVSESGALVGEGKMIIER